MLRSDSSVRVSAKSMDSVREKGADMTISRLTFVITPTRWAWDADAYPAVLQNEI